ncbi:MAG: peptidylprolyl isomerase [Clostridia bacterium]|nr:peptidylprolyl isomerase [Clostridia bacterium]
MKKRNARLTLRKQEALEKKEKQKRNKKIAKITAIVLACVIVVSAIATWIALASRPYYAHIEIEGYGTIVVKLNDDEAPITVNHFVGLAESGFYNGTTFFRVIENNLIQGGMPKDGKESTDFVTGEFERNGYENNVTHERGTITLTRKQGEPEEDFYNTGTTQFAILQRSQPALDGAYAAFGMVVSGMEIVDKICAEVKPSDSSGTVPAAAQPVIKSITITRSFEE